jgi:hypothetical protein
MHVICSFFFEQAARRGGLPAPLFLMWAERKAHSRISVGSNYSPHPFFRLKNAG